ncbi:MAG: bifunctional diaminohydroxyphosphoribosylaminopyrimidine deaminase/5-amino-6-(5-phosphoribosylamino)uracil reductase RibD [Flavobacteriales bacterium]
MNSHEYYMTRCLELASKGLPGAMPNPSVGAVLVYKDKIIGEGFTSPYGGSHGEVNCINSVSKENQDHISKSTLYVSLEPCSHFGKTPPCADLIIKNKIPTVVIGCVDTFSEVAGKGIERLKNNGITVLTGVLEKECRELNKRFFTFHEKKRPYIVLKWAQTKDEFIAPESIKHEQERWITGSKTKQFVHQLRANEMAILVGTNTVIMDDPSLTVREVSGKNPIRVVIDRELKLWNQKEKYKVFDNESETLIINEKENFISNSNEGVIVNFDKNLPSQLCEVLYQKGIQSLIVEGGTKTLQSFINSNLWDEAFVFEGNKSFGSGVEAPKFNNTQYKELLVGEDKLSIFKNDNI